MITTAGEMATRYVIHTVGPIWHGGDRNEEQLLRNAYLNSLRIALENNLDSVSFPSISTGAYRYPIEDAARIALKAVRDFLGEHNLQEVRFVLFSEGDLQVYQKAFVKINEG